jgi:hypothetical protein
MAATPRRELDDNSVVQAEQNPMPFFSLNLRKFIQGFIQFIAAFSHDCRSGKKAFVPPPPQCGIFYCHFRRPHTLQTRLLAATSFPLITRAVYDRQNFAGHDGCTAS